MRGSDRYVKRGVDSVIGREMWVAGASAVIAIGSLVVSVVTASTLIRQETESRTHYRKIVTPMVLAHVTSNPVVDTWGIFLKNEGIGPAVINYQRVILDGKISDMRGVEIKMRKEGALGPNTQIGVDDLHSGSYLGVGRRKTILEVDPKSLGALASTKFREFIRHRIDVRYEWCSVYEECKYGCTKDKCTVLQGPKPKP